MKRFITVLFFFSTTLLGESLDSLDSLLQSVKSSSITQSKLDKERLKAFKDAESQQKEALAKIKAEYEAELKRSELLKSTIDTNEKELTRLEEKLKIRVGNLGEMFGVVRQVGGDLKVSIANSSTSTTIKGREESLGAMLESKELPDIAKLEELWYLLQEEIIESGRVTKQKQSIIDAEGKSVEAEVMGVGVFNAYVEDRFLRYSAETNSYVELPTQPSSRLRSIAGDFVDSDAAYARAVIDPTRGEILAMLTQKPTLTQRIEQGGVVGYIILTLGLIGAIIATYRYMILNRVNQEVQSQLLLLDTPNDANPLGRVLKVFESYKDIDLQSFEAKLEEAVLKELPKLKAYENIIKLIATVAPLLGLLGTVTGMIETFGAITLFGTGDPKLMAGGISQALMTTVLGLVVAIPMLFLYTFVSSRSNKIVSILDEQSAGLVVKKMETCNVS
jgi:biopolymer transport protein ExbB